MDTKTLDIKRTKLGTGTLLAESQYPSLGHMVSMWAERTPKAPAICQGDRVWSYAELVSTAGNLACSLPPGEIVAVTGQQSFGLVAGILAVLASGSVLLTVDPNLPERRQRLLVEQAGARRLLVAGEIPVWMREHPWDSMSSVEPNQPASNSIASFPTEPLPNDPAYVFFTSGSTGMPKGVLGCHKGLSHFLNWERDAFCVGPGDRIAQLTNLSFDAVLRSIFLPLVSGGTLCLPPESFTLAGSSVLPWMQSAGITLVHTVPSLAHTWLTDVPPGTNLPELRLLFFSGEPLHESLVRRWRLKFPSSRVVNLYGPTETTMIKFYYEIPPEPDHGVQPAGWPLPETEGLLLDEEGAMCGLGQVGEIVIRTPFRTLGYTNAPEEQQRRFVGNPFRDDASDVLYRTGDRGRYRADGALEILGRLDDQLKIQGVRVEPDEVSAALMRHPGVQACVVAAHPDSSQNLMLVAYVVGPGAEAEEFRSFLSRELPAAMIPSSYVSLDRLPLNPNGKVDRKALPLPGAARSFVAPRTLLEQKLANLWQQMLGVDRVGLEDNFFELGGNSVGLAQVHGKMRTLIDRDIPITDLFQYPTIRSLANHLNQKTPRKSAFLNARQRAARQIAARTGETAIEEDNGQ